jgi:hypothetical protein
MAMVRILLIPVILLLLVMNPGVMPGEPPAPDRDTPAIFQEGEELTYEVRWTMFSIGTVRILSLPGHRARAWIDSFDNLPFVDLHSVYFAAMDSALYSLGSWAIDRTESGWSGTNYLCQPGSPRVVVQDVLYTDPDAPPVRREVRDTVIVSSARFVDGLSIGYFPRTLIRTVQRAEVPTILNGKPGMTTFYFEGAHTEEEIDAVEYPVKVVEVHGKTDVVGVFGMTGDFTGWFSDDEAAVPIKGELNVLLGKVSIELIRWKRTGWTPPGRPG